MTMKKIIVLTIAILITNCLYAKEKVAVLDPSSTLSKKNTDIIREVITEELDKSDNYTLIERSSIKLVLKEIGYQQSGAVDEKDASRIGKQLGADLILITVAHELGSQVFVSCRLVNVETARVVGTATGKNRDVLSAGKSAVKKFLKRPGLRKPAVPIVLNILLPFGIGSYAQKDPNAWILTLVDLAGLGSLGGYLLVSDDIVNNGNNTSQNTILLQTLFVSGIVMATTSAVLSVAMPLGHYKKLQKGNRVSFYPRFDLEQDNRIAGILMGMDVRYKF